MRVLICTQAVDKHDPVLGFFHRWIEEFAKHCDNVQVICLRKGEYSLPSNVQVYSLGKENGGNRLQYAWRFYKILGQLRGTYDSVFVHMNPEYVLLGGLWWRLARKTVGLWYLHKSVDLKLKLAVPFVQHVFSASKESFRLPTKKLHLVGHGIDTEHFSPGEKTTSNTLRLLFVGRLGIAKRLDVLVEALKILVEKNVPVSLAVVGEPATKAEQTYVEEVKKTIETYDLGVTINFTGGVSYAQLPRYYREHDLFVHLSETGSVDKVVLEALACELPVISSSEAFVDILPKERLLQDKNPMHIANAIEQSVHKNSDIVALRNYVTNTHSLPQLINRILNTYRI